MKSIKFIAACALLAGATASFGHENMHNNHPAVAPQQQEWGIAGEAKGAKRTITLRMTDDMRFTPSHFTVKQGETVRLRVENKGQVMHEVVLGTQGTL
ncbi:MAG: hypothetical protein E7K47_17595, partial [Acidovorax sp.]|nr:hypothetical protein [Acidovorax sp.]